MTAETEPTPRILVVDDVAANVRLLETILGPPPNPATWSSWGPAPGHHVAMVLQPGDDPLLVSDGQENGPFAIRFSAEDKAQGLPATWLSCLH
jgi:CheY-like chemotaxis protein